jgi:uncharacterized protein YjbI with pentapeptide repeats
VRRAHGDFGPYDPIGDKALSKAEISNRNITGKVYDSILRDCTVKYCTVTRCELYNCTIENSRFFDSEDYQCNYGTTGTSACRNTFSRCKIYSCRLTQGSDISNSELHNTTISSYEFQQLQDSVDRTRGLAKFLPKGPSISRSELHRSVVTWPPDTKADIGIERCELFDCTLENPAIGRSKLRRCKITSSIRVDCGIRDTTQTVQSSTLIECDIGRIYADRCIILKCKLKYLLTLESHVVSCTIRKSSICPSSTPPHSVVSKALEDFPDVLAKYPGSDDDQSIRSLAHFPMEIQVRIIHYAAALLKLKGGTPPLIEAVRGNQLLYSSALSAFAKENWHSVRAVNYNESIGEPNISPKAWQEVRKLAIR